MQPTHNKKTTYKTSKAKTITWNDWGIATRPILFFKQIESSFSICSLVLIVFRSLFGVSRWSDWCFGESCWVTRKCVYTQFICLHALVRLHAFAHMRIHWIVVYGPALGTALLGEKRPPRRCEVGQARAPWKRCVGRLLVGLGCGWPQEGVAVGICTWAGKAISERCDSGRALRKLRPSAYRAEVWATVWWAAA